MITSLPNTFEILYCNELKITMIIRTGVFGDIHPHRDSRRKIAITQANCDRNNIFYKLTFILL